MTDRRVKPPPPPPERTPDMTDKPDTIAIDNARYAAAQIDAIAHHIDRLITTIEAWFDFRPDPQITDLLEMLSAAALAAQPAITNAAARARVAFAPDQSQEAASSHETPPSTLADPEDGAVDGSEPQRRNLNAQTDETDDGPLECPECGHHMSAPMTLMDSDGETVTS